MNYEDAEHLADQAEQKRQYLVYQLRCLESKLDRVEPFSPEFDETTDQIFQTMAEIRTAALAALTARIKACDAEAERGRL